MAVHRADVLRHAERRSRWTLVPGGWQIYALFLGFPIWWVLGLDAFIWPVLAFPLFCSLLLRGSIPAPRFFWLWACFLIWMLASGTRVEGEWRWLAFAYRAALYLSATVLFLYIYGSSRRRLPDESAIRALTLYWCLVILGGFLGVLFPQVSFATLATSTIPKELLSNRFVYDLTHHSFADIHSFMGYPAPRPKVLFAYTNAWGSTLALLTPFALAFLATSPPRWQRLAVMALLVASIVPLVFSLNRGAWLSLAVGLAYAVLRFALSGQVRAVGGVAVLAVAIGLAIAYTPLGEVAADRLAHPHSNAGRLSLYQEALSRSAGAPFLGFGAPRPSEENPNLPSVGTHGQLLLILFSHGVPGLVFFLAWFAYTLWRSGSRGSPARFWMHVVILMALVQSPYYELLPMQLHVVMVAAALAWREIEQQVPLFGRVGVGRAAIESVTRTG